MTSLYIIVEANITGASPGEVFMTTYNSVFVLDVDKKPQGEQIKGAGVPALPLSLKPRHRGTKGTQVTGRSSSVLGVLQ